MRRVDIEDLRIGMAVKLRLLPGSVLRDLASKLPVVKDAAVDQAIDAILKALPKDAVVIAPSLVNNSHWGQKPGEWGVTEPYPFEELDRVPEPPGR